MATRCAQYQLEPNRLAVREARLRVRQFGDLPAHTTADGELVVSELVANSVLHARLQAGSMIDLVLRRDADRLTIEVDDHGSFSGRPQSRRGLGLRLLDAVCESWQASAGHVRASIAITAVRAPHAGDPGGVR